MATQVTPDRAAEILAEAINGVNGPAPSEPFVPPGPPTGYALILSGIAAYGASLGPWIRGALLAVGGLVAGTSDPALVAVAVPVGALGARWWTAARIARRNRRVRSGADTDGRAVRVATVARRKARATTVGATVGLWLLAASTVGQTVGFGGTVGALFWLAAVGFWATLSVPAWTVVDGRRRPVGDTVNDATDGPTVAPSTDGFDDAPTVRLSPVNDRRPTAENTTDGTVGRPTVVAPPTGDSRPTPTVRRSATGRYPLPSLALLSVGPPAPRRTATVGDSITKVIDGTCREHGVGGKVIGVTVGPTVTRYAVALDRGVKVNAFTNLEPELTKALRVADPITMLKSVPGQNAVGVEVPNATRGVVTLGDVLRSAQAILKGYALGIGVGCTVDGQPIVADLAKLPHVAIAGTTGSGKTVALNALIVSLLMFHGPDSLGLQLIDPKQVELTKYEALAHLIAPIATEFDDAIGAFGNLKAEMDRRYKLLRAAGCRDIAEYNDGVAAGRIAGERLRRIVAICDELADLILENKARRKAARRDEDPGPDLEQLIVRLLQLARAAGIHLVLATQRPSADVVTGLISANLPARLAFAAAKLADSMVILDRPGAEKLIGRGDGLWQPTGAAMTRLQGAAVTDAEIDAVVAFWAALGVPVFDPTPPRPAPQVHRPPVVAAEPLARDVVLTAALEMADPDGLVDKRSIVAATPGMRPGTRDKALADLVEGGLLERLPNGRGAYRVPDNDLVDTVSAGDGEPQ